jgi:cardiolipin synthase
VLRIKESELRQQAERIATASVSRSALALEFQESVASSVEVHVEGRNFYPPMLADVASAKSSVHINQFGFKPGVIGDKFADALLAKAAESVRVRLVVDLQGTNPEGGSRALYQKLVAGGVEVCVVRASKFRVPEGPLGSGGARRWNFGALTHVDHRKVLVIDGGVGWVGGAGIEDHFQDGRFHDLFLRLEGPVVAQLQLVFVSSFRWLGGAIPQDELDALFPSLDGGSEPIPAVVLHNAPGKFRPISTAIGQLLEGASEKLDVVNPYVTDRKMIGRIADAARRGVAVRLFVPRDANNWAWGAAAPVDN